MKTNKLFGVQFAQNDQFKNTILADFQQWKTTKFKQDLTAGLISDSVLETDPNIVQSPNGSYVLDFSKVRGLLAENGCHHYLITNSVLEMCEKIRVKEPFELQWLSQVPDGKRQLNFDDTLLRYDKKEDHIHAVAVRKSKVDEKSHYISYNFFHFDLAQRAVSEYIADDFDPASPIANKDFDVYAKKSLYQLIIFMELADVEEVYLPPGQSHGRKRNQDKILNDSKFPITKVTTSWNKIIRTAGFAVSGYLKKQPWGPKNKNRKLIWIDPYHKEGYNLGAKAQKAPPRIIQDDKPNRRMGL